MPLGNLLGHGVMPRYSASFQNAQDGRRLDFTPKGQGYFGRLSRSDGSVSTELSFDFDYGGKQILAPLIVPTLSKQELNFLLNGNKPTEDIYAKAADYALERLRNGKGAFANPLEVFPLPK